VLDRVQKKAATFVQNTSSPNWKILTLLRKLNRPEGPAQRLAPCASSLARGQIVSSLMRGYFPAIGYQQAELEGVGGGSLCRFVCLSLHSLSYSDRRGRRINPLSLSAGEPRRGS